MAERNGDPFPHAIVGGVLPGRVYEQFCADFPATVSLVPVAQRHPKGGYPEARLSLQTIEDGIPGTAGVDTPSLVRVAAMLADPVTGRALIERFSDIIAPRIPPALAREGIWIGASVEMIRDESGFALRPHTDGRRKLVTALLYAPEPGSSEDLGTELYAPMVNAATSDGTGYFDPSQFERRAKAPYVANTMIAFARTDRSFHGVAAVAPGSVRRLIQISFLALKAPAPEARFAFRWTPEPRDLC
ncbi:MAG: hypothetical protein HQ481_06635 [Alphaproteobacteria bacterium]|nr:hypothetical protein [Alphaproteobacteria bacterium]